MKKVLKKALLLTLSLCMIFNTNVIAFASDNTQVENSAQNDSLIIVDDGVYIDNKYYTQDEFIKLLETAIEVDAPQPKITGALVAGTWFIPGIGEVVITVTGTIIVAGVVAKAGSWVYNTVQSWFKKRAFNQSAEDAINNCNENKRNHIMNPKHNWTKLKKSPNWNNISPILIKVLQDGDEKWEKGNQYLRILVYNGEKVVVRFIKDAEGLVQYVGTAWCE